MSQQQVQSKCSRTYIPFLKQPKVVTKYVTCYTNSLYHGSWLNKSFKFKVRLLSMCRSDFVVLCTVTTGHEVEESARELKRKHTSTPGNRWNCFGVANASERVHKTWIFSAGLRRKTKYQISSKSVQCESSCSMRPDRMKDGRTDWQSEELLYFTYCTL